MFPSPLGGFTEELPVFKSIVNRLEKHIKTNKALFGDLGHGVCGRCLINRSDD